MRIDLSYTGASFEVLKLTKKESVKFISRH